jgi:hypothetical protein
LIQQQCGLAKERVTQNRINKAKSRMVEEVKRLGAELQIQAVVNINLPPDCSVDLKVAKASQQVPRRVPGSRASREIKGWIGNSGSAIEDATPRVFRSMQVQGPAGYQVHATVISFPRSRIGEEIPHQVDWKARSCRESTVRSPAPNKVSVKPVSGQLPAIPGERRL